MCLCSCLSVWTTYYLFILSIDQINWWGEPPRCTTTVGQKRKTFEEHPSAFHFLTSSCLNLEGRKHRKGDGEEERKTMKKKEEESVFANAGFGVWDPKFWQMEDHTYCLARKKQESVNVSTLKYNGGIWGKFFWNKKNHTIRMSHITTLTKVCGTPHVKYHMSWSRFSCFATDAQPQCSLAVWTQTHVWRVL